MNNTERKHLICLIETYLQDDKNTININKIKKHSYKLGFTNGIIHERSLRKTLDILKNKTFDNLVSTQNDKMNGLYHERFCNKDTFCNDAHDVFSMDCQEQPFCMHHRRYGETQPSYKYHYNCKYNNRIHNKDKTKWVSNKFVCFDCKKMSKRYNNNDTINIYDNWQKCANCNKYMECVGVEFTIPPKKNKKHWERLEKEWYKYSRMTYYEYINK